MVNPYHKAAYKDIKHPIMALIEFGREVRTKRQRRLATSPENPAEVSVSPPHSSVWETYYPVKYLLNNQRKKEMKSMISSFLFQTV